MVDHIIEVRNLDKSFGDRKILDGINVDFERGKTIVIMGGSGCGKTTFLRILIGMLRPDTGSVRINNIDIAKADEDQLIELRKKFGMLFQGSALFNSMTVGDNVALALREHTDLDEEIIRIMVKIKLEMVGLSGFEHLKPAEISGGMKKRVGLARAIAMDPELVFYDEPGAGLDPVVMAVIDKLIFDLSKKLGMTSIVVTHEMESAFRIADKIIMLYEGKILEQGTVDEIKNSKNPVVQQFITGSAEGPIALRRSGEDYFKELTEES